MRNGFFALGALNVALFCSPLAVLASTFSFTGAFGADDDIQLFNFSIASPATVTIQSWGFAGGTNANGQLIPAGGFATDLSLFDVSGNLLTLDSGGIAPSLCSPRNIDSVTGFCLDAYINIALGSGQYVLALTEDNNLPFGPTLSDGFLQQGQGNFTGPAVGQADGSFLLITGDQRTNQWALDIGSVDSAEIPSAVPEPSLIVPMILLLALAAACRCKVIARPGELR